MLTKLIVRNLKCFGDIEVELGSPVVFVGPNDCGKTTALQALALWNVGLRRWTEKRKGSSATKRPGVAINRKALLAIPVPSADLLWRGRHTRDVTRISGRPETQNVRIDVLVEGTGKAGVWRCGLEFDYANEESIYCRPLRSDAAGPERMDVPGEAEAVSVAFLPPMSGLASEEPLHAEGRVDVLIGQGRTAEVLRNLCYEVHEKSPERWETVRQRIAGLFGATLEEPSLVPERGEIALAYRNREGVALDVSSSGRGMQQVLLLLAFMEANRGSVLLLDEPDAHLEILRQREVYRTVTEAAKETGSQIVIASHSEVILNEAAENGTVVAFVGRPHRIDDRGSQVLKSLKTIGFDQYYQAEIAGWVLYLEGSSDLGVLAAFAESLGHPAREDLRRPFTCPVLNQPANAYEHFFGLREARPDLVGFALFDRLDAELETKEERGLMQHSWRRREIENYLCSPATLLAWAEATARASAGGELIENADAKRWLKTMQECIGDRVAPAALRDQSDPWWRNVKASDEFLDPLFDRFYASLGLPDLMRKSSYAELARFVAKDEIDPEVAQVLDMIRETAGRARPVGADGPCG